MPEAEAGDTAPVQQDFDLLHQVVRDAGAMGLDYYHRADVEVRDKGGNDPVTEADLAIDSFLKDKLQTARPHYGWLSEETEDDRDRLDAPRCWIVDPIDGTRAFVNRRPEWCVAAALVEQGEPIAAAVFNPLTDEYYTAVKGLGAFLNGEKISVDNPDALAGARILTTSSDLRKRLWTTHFSDIERFHINSLAYKISLVAAAKYDAFFSLRGCNDWDIAGATLIAEEAGLDVTDLLGARLAFNQPRTRHGAMVVAPKQMADEIRHRLKELLSSEARLPGDRPA